MPGIVYWSNTVAGTAIHAAILYFRGIDYKFTEN
jgi:hypothetical protein